MRPSLGWRTFVSNSSISPHRNSFNPGTATACLRDNGSRKGWRSVRLNRKKANPIQDPSAARSFVNSSKTPDPVIRATALDGLLPDDTIPEAILRRYLAQPVPLGRAAAIQELDRRKVSDIRSILEKYQTDPSETVRYAVADACEAHVELTPILMKAISLGMEDDWRYSTAFEKPEREPFLLQCLRSKNERLQAFGFRSIPQQPGKNAIEERFLPVVMAFAKDPSESVRRYVASILSEFDTEAVLETLREMAGRATDEELVHIVRNYPLTGSDHGRFIRTYAEHPNPDVRSVALKKLKRLKTTSP